MKVTTNNVPREIIEGYQLTPKEREEFDYIDWPAIDRGEDSASFVRYKGETYDLSEFETWYNHMSPMKDTEWDGFKAETFFSGILVRYAGDVGQFDHVVMGRYCT